MECLVAEFRFRCPIHKCPVVRFPANKKGNTARFRCQEYILRHLRADCPVSHPIWLHPYPHKFWLCSLQNEKWAGNSLRKRRTGFGWKIPVRYATEWVMNPHYPLSDWNWVPDESTNLSSWRCAVLLLTFVSHVQSLWQATTGWQEL